MFPMFTAMPSCQRQRQRRHPCNMERNRNSGEFWPFVATSDPFANMNFDFESDSETPAHFMDLLKTISDRINSGNEKMNRAANKKHTSGARPGRCTDHDACRSNNTAKCEQSRRGGENYSDDSSSTRDRQEPKFWRQEVDCKGFKSKSIRVKIDARLLLIKASQVDESEFGVQTSSMRKSVPLPENIDRAKLTCKLSPNGKLIVQAPFVPKSGMKDKPDGCQLLRELVSAILPGIEHSLRAHFGDENHHNEKCEKEDSSKKTNNDEMQNNDEKRNENGTASSERTPEDTNKQDEVKAVQDNCSVPVQDDSMISDKHQTCDMQETSEDVSQSPHDTEPMKPIISSHVMEADDDNESVNTEDSFVLLSELEKDAASSSLTPDSKVCENNYTVDLPEEDGTDDNDKENEAEKTPEVEVVELQKSKPDATSNRQLSPDCALSGNTDTKPHPDSISSNLHDNDRPSRDDQVSSSQQSTTSFKFKDDRNEQDGFRYRVEMPSYDPETICVNFDEGKRLLVISASKNSIDPSTGAAETITKTVHVDEEIDVNELRCYFRDGSLSVTAPSKTLVKNIPVLK